MSLLHLSVGPASHTDTQPPEPSCVCCCSQTLGPPVHAGHNRVDTRTKGSASCGGSCVTATQWTPPPRRPATQPVCCPATQLPGQPPNLSAGNPDTQTRSRRHAQSARPTTQLPSSRHRQTRSTCPWRPWPSCQGQLPCHSAAAWWQHLQAQQQQVHSSSGSSNTGRSDGSRNRAVSGVHGGESPE